MTVSSTPEDHVLSAETIAVGLMSYVVLLFSLSVHESAHAWTALRQGDPTARSPSAGSASTRSSTST